MRNLTSLSSNPALMSAFGALLVNLGISGASARQDAAGDTLFLARELEQVSAQSYDVLIDPIKGRLLVPFSAEVDEGAETFSYDMYDGFALAEWITNWASPVGQAEAFKTRTSKTMRSFGSSYSYSVQDLRAAAFARRPVDRERAKKARIAHEQFIDNVVAVGDATRSIEGLTNNASFASVATTGGSWASLTTSDADKAKIFADLTKLCQTPEQSSKGNWKADTLVLPLVKKPQLSAPYSIYDATPVWKKWLSTQEDITRIEWWARLDTASASGGPRAIAYKNSPEIMKFLLSFDYRELPPKQEGYTFQILTEARIGGLSVVYPMACAKMDLDA